MEGSRSLHQLVTALTLVLVAQPAEADDTQKCVDAYVQAQRLQRADQLLAARVELAVCADAKCPDAVRIDCLEWKASNEAAIPSILLQPGLPDGASPSDLRVEVDGRQVTTPVPGQLLELEPGTHRLRFTLPGSEPIEERVQLRPGERAHQVAIQLAPGDSVPAGPSAESVAAIGLWALGGAGVALFAVLGTVGRREIDDLSESCAPSCTEDQVDVAWNKLIAADVSGAVGLVALAVGTVVYFAQPDERSSQTGRLSRPRVDVGPLAGGALFQAAIGF
jgi:hypothetical protein